MWMHGYPDQRREEKEEMERWIETMMNLDEIDSAIDTFYLLNEIIIEFAFLFLHVKKRRDGVEERSKQMEKQEGTRAIAQEIRREKRKEKRSERREKTKRGKDNGERRCCNDMSTER